MIRLWGWGLSLFVVVLAMGYVLSQQQNENAAARGRADAIFLKTPHADAATPAGFDEGASLAICGRMRCDRPTETGNADTPP